MGIINLLENNLSDLIAAGEVVERPSSVVKELIENAIDAKSTQIDIIILSAGRKLIEVIDNGIGMDNSDAITAFKRHATSKIRSKEDLLRIATLGFRGEALPSIAAVSEVEVITSTGGVGTHVVINNSKMIINEPAKARKGTSIKVNNLFYNTPARLKHLKSDNTEIASIMEVVSHLALGYPNIRFTLINEQKEIFATNGNGNILEMIAKVYGVETAKQMIKIDFEDYDFKVSGFTSKIEVSRANRYSIITLLNGRYVKINSAVNALIEAYHTYLPSDRFPLAIINIELDPFLVDVNVHPSKQLVRLSKESELAKLIKDNIEKVLKNTLMIPSFEKAKETKEIIIKPTFNFDSPNFIENNKESLLINDIDNKKEQLLINEVNNEKEEKINNDNIQEVKDNLYFRIIGQYHGTYIACEFDDAFVLVDQHAAAERINYEKYFKLLGTNEATMPLLIPLIIDRTNKEINDIMEKEELLKSLGLFIERFGTSSLRISEIPHFMMDVDIKVYADEIFEIILGNISVTLSQIRQHAIATMACKASIKANHNLSQLVMEKLVKELFKCDNPHTCPHGRPTMIKYINYELEKYFKRS